MNIDKRGELHLNKEEQEELELLCSREPVENPETRESWLEKITALNKLIKDERESEGELVSHIAHIMDNVLDAADIPDKIDLLGTKLIEAYQMIVRLVRVIRTLNEEIEQRKNQQVNLERRVFALDGGQPQRNKRSYKQYTNE